MTMILHPLDYAAFLSDDELRSWCGRTGYDYEMIAAMRDRRIAVPERMSAPFAYGESYCHAGRDGDCRWSGCPQIRDNEPEATGRHCPLDNGPEED